MMKLNLNQYILGLKKNKKIRSNAEVAALLVGRTLTIIGNSNSHSYGPAGTKFKVANLPSVGTAGSGSNLRYRASGLVTNGNTIEFADLSININDKASLTAARIELQETINSATKHAALLDEKLEFLEAEGLEEYDDFNYALFKAKRFFQSKADKEEIKKEELEDFITSLGIEKVAE